MGAADGRAGAARVRPRLLRPPALRSLLLGDDRSAEGDRPPPRRNPDRGVQERGPELGPAARRQADVVHDHGLDDVDGARQHAAAPGLDRDARRQPDVPGPIRPVEARRGAAPDADGRGARIPDGLPQGWRGPPRHGPVQHPAVLRSGLARSLRRASTGSTSSSARTCCSTSAAAGPTSAPAWCRGARCSRCTGARSPAAASRWTLRHTTRTPSRWSASWGSW